jgi:hypothetical protein
VAAAVSISGGTPSNQYITRDDGPAIFFHGTEDTTVPYFWAVSNAGAMYNLGIPVVLEAFEGAGHGLTQAGYGVVIREQASYFLYGTMNLAEAAGQPASAARAFRAYKRRLLSKNPGLRRLKPVRERAVAP